MLIRKRTVLDKDSPSGGLKDQPLSEAFSFHYQAKLDHGLFENEIDHVLFGYFNSEPKLNPAEAMAFRWISLKDLRADVKINPRKYTFWLKEIIANREGTPFDSNRV